ncbi:putative secreted protein [Corynebacterium deserti GIMN1.010]|uniref:Putative secreted protein n=1 Tax=Corynebacterium deserti GIMN1.010 TaxID=931089 RepID=A0A0M3Q9F6_9CORY|nr:hypothetical protein [Corynebacterium deserti]ALC05543.1 putative secreted protein [Corynebacterium deserti GIMN1.010]
MKLRRIAAATLASVLGLSTVLVPQASAVTVQIGNSNLCRFAFTEQDFNLLVAAAADPDKATLQRLNALFPTIEGGLNLLVSEVEAQILASNNFDSTKLSEAADSDFDRYLTQGLGLGFTQNELMAMLLGAVMSPLLVKVLNSQKGVLVGSFHLTKGNAQNWIDIIADAPKGFGFDFARNTYLDQPLSDATMNVLAPSIAIHANLLDAYSTPFEACIAGTPINGGGGGNGGDGNGNGGDGNGNGGGRGGSSFGSS